MTPSTSSGLTLPEIFACIPPGDDRLAALAAWRQAQDRLNEVIKPPPVKLARKEPEPPKITEHVETAPDVAVGERVESGNNDGTRLRRRRWRTRRRPYERA
jgi:hypothetical protein